MSKTRVYVPSTLTRLRDVVAAGGIGPLPVLARAVTETLRLGDPDGSEEDWEYAAMSAAAQDSLGLLGEDDPPRRVVVAVDVDSVIPLDPGDPTLVELREVASARSIAALHVDSADDGDVIAAGRAAWVEAGNGDPVAAAAVERCLEHELGWFAAQEIGELLEP